MTFKYKVKKTPDSYHVTIRLFVADHPDRTFANCGTLTMLRNEWMEFLRTIIDQKNVLVEVEGNSVNEKASDRSEVPSDSH